MIEIQSKKIDRKNLEDRLNKIIDKYENSEKKERKIVANENEVQIVPTVEIKEDEKDIYVMQDFTNYHNEVFINKVYKLVLRRDATREEINYYMNLLESGEKSKTEILVYIRFSKEGKEQNVNIKNIRLYYLLIRSFSIPIIGSLFRWTFSVVSLPKLLKRYNILESRLMLEKELLEQQMILERESLKEELHRVKEELNLYVLQMQELANNRSLKQEREKEIFDALYIDFEEQFRGARETIKKRQAYYLPMVKKILQKIEAPLLDIGCGRGEWLELLKENGIEAKGIDLNSMMIQEALQYKLDVENIDVLEYLKSLNSNSLSVVTAFHIVEHLSLEVLIEMLDEIYRVLKKGGMVILETPNPENVIVGSCSFYTDPTHKNPIPPVTLEFFVKHRGFSAIELYGLHALKTISEEDIHMAGVKEMISFFNKEQDYALIGYKI